MRRKEKVSRKREGWREREERRIIDQLVKNSFGF